MKVLELFGGIGACTQALKRLGIDFEVVDYVDNDKYAVKSYNAINGTNYEPQDICEWNKNIQADLIMHGSPCQDFSLAGQQAGGDEGSETRSSLMYETIRIVKNLLPKYVIWENVKNILSKKHRHNFENYLKELRNLGYVNYYQVLNAKDYGIPQNRERVFTVSIRRDVITENYQLKDYVFPEKQELKLRLKDLLEDEVDEKYYLSNKGVFYFKQQAIQRGENINEAETKKLLTIGHGENKGSMKDLDISPTLDTNFSNFWRGVLLEPVLVKNKGQEKEKGNGFRFGVSDGNIIAKAVTTRAGSRMDDNFIQYNNQRANQTIENHKEEIKENSFLDCYNDKVLNDGTIPTMTSRISASNNYFLAIKNANSKGYDEATEGDSIDLTYPNSTTRRGRVGHQVSQTILASDTKGVVVPQYNNLRIRKLTPKECWRLMGFSDEAFDKASQVNSNTQLYKQAGNSIVVNVLVEIFRNLL